MQVLAGITLQTGGSGGNTAIQLAALKQPPFFIYASGRDDFAEYYEKKLKQHGVHPVPLRTTTSPTAVCICISGLSLFISLCYNPN